MTPIKWYSDNKHKFHSEYEHVFFKKILMHLPNLDFSHVHAQLPFKDDDGKQRYCDFAINESENIRLAIEIDGYDKSGNGQGMSHDDFVDWQRRQAALTSQGWYILRFANRDIRDEPKRCHENIKKTLHRLRTRDKLHEISDENKKTIENKKIKKRNILRKIKENTINFLYAWGVILVANQLLIFGGCFAPYCILAAMPHTFIITAIAFAIYIKHIQPQA